MVAAEKLLKSYKSEATMGVEVEMYLTINSLVSLIITVV